MLISLTRTNLIVNDKMFIYTSMGKHYAAAKIQTHIHFMSKRLTKWRININSDEIVAIFFGKKLPITFRPI